MEKQHLSGRVKIIWFAPALVLIAAVWFFGAISQVVSGSPVALSTENSSLLTIIILIVALVYIHYNYENYYYELAERELIIRRGIIEKRVDVIPFDRIQHIRTERTAIEIILGLVHIHIDTAGALDPEDQTKISGIDFEQHDELIEALNDKIQRAKHRSRKMDERMETLMVELLKETKITNDKLDKLLVHLNDRPLRMQ